jgi:eukaryotic-like serine/threonine-protein kinase
VSLATGTRLGGYEVVGLLGAGGMGQVYRARDTKLNRYVAIKVLPGDVARDLDRLARFTREAQTLAALNHPNIAHIHGLEEFDGVVALIMELVEGDDLSVLIARGPMPIAEALPIARQIAEALEAAHEEGFIHHDLKPANVKVRPDGTVKLLDFGLAKALSQDDPKDISGTMANSPTIASPAMTAMGVILGTAAYMAPEQARGKGIDRRVDVWAFGVVFYEMLTGIRLFEGATVAETLGLIFSREPDLTRLPLDTPAGVRRIIGRCLVKDPRQRLRDAGDARLLIDDALEGRGEPTTASGPSAASGAVPVAAPARGRATLMSVGAILVAVAAAAGGWFARPSPMPSPVRLSIALPPGEQVTAPPAISPDGQMIAYGAGKTTSSSQLYLRSLTDFTPHAVANSSAALYPFFSPDGRSIGFFSGGRLRRSSTAGGGTMDLAHAPAPWGAAWCADGTIVYAPTLGGGLWRVKAEGGPPVQLTKPDGDANGYAHVLPQRLVGTDDVLFGFWGQVFYTAVLSSKTNTWRHVSTNGRAYGAAAYAPAGLLLGNDDKGNVTAGRWTPSTTDLVTPDVPAFKDVYWALATMRPWLAVSENGTAVYVPGSPNDRRVAWVDRLGRAELLPGEPSAIFQAILSHDGKRVLVGGTNDKWIVDLATGVRTRILSDTRSWSGAWLPGDTRIAFSSNKDGDWDLYTVSADGGEPTRLLRRPFAQHVEAVEPDGTIVFLERQPATGNDLLTLSPDGRVAPLVLTPFNEESASVSPDGRFVAYASDESGHYEVYVVPASGKGTRVTVSLDGGTGPVWSRDGHQLFYRAGDELVGVQVRLAPELTLGTRQTLLDLSAYDSGYLHEFDVSADGQRFLLVRSAPESRPTRLDLVLNWSEEVRKLGGN